MVISSGPKLSRNRWLCSEGFVGTEPLKRLTKNAAKLGIHCFFLGTDSSDLLIFQERQRTQPRKKGHEPAKRQKSIRLMTIMLTQVLSSNVKHSTSVNSSKHFTPFRQ